MSSVEEFRTEFRNWLAAHLTGEFASLRGRGGPGREHEAFAERLGWERHMAAEGWTCVGWPKEYGGRGATLEQQVAFHEEYALADAPARVGHIGEQLLGPTLIAFGTPQQQERFLPPIVAARELWCQGYSEPDAGSDLANVRTRAERDEGAPPARAEPGVGETGSSPGRRSGPHWPTSPTGASSSPAPKPDRPATRACPTSWCRWTSPASRSGRSTS